MCAIPHKTVGDFFIGSQFISPSTKSDGRPLSIIKCRRMSKKNRVLTSYNIHTNQHLAIRLHKL